MTGKNRDFDLDLWQRCQAGSRRMFGTPRVALAISHRRVDFLNPHLEQRRADDIAYRGWIPGNLSFFAIIVRLP